MAKQDDQKATDAQALADERKKLKAEAKALAEERARLKAETKALAEERAKLDAETKALAYARAQVASKTKALADERAKVEADAQALAEERAGEVEEIEQAVFGNAANEEEEYALLTQALADYGIAEDHLFSASVNLTAGSVVIVTNGGAKVEWQGGCMNHPLNDIQITGINPRRARKKTLTGKRK